MPNAALAAPGTVSARHRRPSNSSLQPRFARASAMLPVLIAALVAASQLAAATRRPEQPKPSPAYDGNGNQDSCLHGCGENYKPVCCNGVSSAVSWFFCVVVLLVGFGTCYGWELGGWGWALTQGRFFRAYHFILCSLHVLLYAHRSHAMLASKRVDLPCLERVGSTSSFALAHSTSL